MIDLSCKLDPKSLMEALARLKGISVSKVVRNASRDFAQAALKATPVAVKSKSEYYYYYDKQGQRKYLHESQLAGRKRLTGLRKVRIAKGWSKSSWLGIFRALGMSMKDRPNRLPQKVEHISYAVSRGNDTQSTTTMTDYIHFDRFGQGQDQHTDSIASAGFKLAAQRMTKEVNRMMIKQWSNQ